MDEPSPPIEPPASPPPAESLGRPRGGGGPGAILRASAGLYRRRAGSLLLIATVFLIPNALLGILERRAAENAAPEVAGPGGEAGSADGGVAPVTPPKESASKADGASEKRPTPDATGEDVIPGFTARNVFERAVWLFMGSLFTSMLAAAVAREAALAVAGRNSRPLQSAGYGFAHVLGLGFLGILAAAWSFFLLLFTAPAFMALSFVEKSLPAGVTSAIAVLLAFPVALVFATFASLGIPVFVVEGRRGMGALLRVWGLVRGELRHAALTVLALLFIGLAASGLALAAAEVTGDSIGPALVVGIVGAPFEALVAFFLYLDLRTRKERVTVATLLGELARNAP